MDVAIIYAGGKGHRLWPVSTDTNPKQISTFFSPRGLLYDTWERTKRLFPHAYILLVITEDIAPFVYQAMQINKDQIIIQPETVNTLASMALAGLILEAKFPNAVAITIYADHLIQEETEYKESILQAADFVRKNKSFVTIATPPQYPSIEYGYAVLGDRCHNVYPIYQAQQFIEKPTREEADRLVKTQQAVWNTGIYIWDSSILLKLYKEHTPKIYADLLNLRSLINGQQYFEAYTIWHKNVERESFDNSITTCIPHLLVYKANFHWRDIGNWGAVYDVAPKDKIGNSIHPDYQTNLISVQATNNYLAVRKKEVAIVGVSNIVVIETNDQLLILNRFDASLVKQIPTTIKQHATIKS